MIIATMNPNAFENILMVAIAPDQVNQLTEQKKEIVRIYGEDHQTIGYNFLNIHQIAPELQFNGTKHLEKSIVDKLNAALVAAGFVGELTPQETPDFVVGYVKEMIDHPDSDHLHITQTQISDDQVVQIVCGAPNIDKGQKVIVATVGAIMPEAKVIWPGELRGQESLGMICAARELNVPNAPQEKGIMVLPDTLPIGSEITVEQLTKLLA